MATSVDFETKYDQKAGFGIKQQGMYTYCLDARFDPYVISVSDGANTWAGQPCNFNWDALTGADLVSHNAGFDSRVYKEMVKRNLAPKIGYRSWRCTANLTAFLCMRRDLMRSVEFLLGIKLEKEVRGKADGKGWAELSAEDGGKSMLDYARKDAYYCWALWNKFGHLWPAFEQKLSDLTIRQSQRGAQIDVDKLNSSLAVAQEALIRIELDLPWMKDGKKPTSPKAIAEECRKCKIPCTPVKARDGDEAFDQWAAAYGPKFSWVSAFSNYRLVNKLIGTLETIKGRLHPDEETGNPGVFSYELLYFGAHTGRWAGAGGFNMQNQRKSPYYFDSNYRLITDEKLLRFIEEEKSKTGALPSLVGFVVDIRSLFVARPGKKLIISDLSQIEPRVLAWLVGDQRKLQLMREGKSPYQAHAEATMGWTRGDMKALIKLGDPEAKEIYPLAKARELGLGYQCAWKKFIVMAQLLAGLDITKEDPEFVQATTQDGSPCYDGRGEPIMISGYGQKSREIVASYRAQNPLVTGLWKTLDEEFKGSVGSDFEITLPSGRKLRYPEVKKERKAIEDPEQPGRFKYQWATTAWVFDQKRNDVVRKPMYGGALTENATQATARDIFGTHLVTLDETAGIDVLFHAHDEAINEVDRGVTKKDVEEIMSKPPEWMPDLPVTAEAIESQCYLK